ncbi:GspH/FimT family pseudopilin [Caenimonas koreensis]|uniref:GspH/FimT family pseudopilin n=1 Tax=Caenimonas koreensis TaxID=367474 RepID=UPI003783BACE
MKTQHNIHAPARQHSGFTLIELMVVVTIVGILMSITLPSMTSLVDSVRLSTATNAFMSSMRLARAESLKRGGRVAMCKSADGASCSTTGGWDQGWIVFVDVNGNGELDASEKLIQRADALGSGIRVTGNQNVSRYIGYVSGGPARMATGALLAGTLTLCHVSGSSADGRQIVISSGGRARSHQVRDGQCV